jgi:hypothetical protein
MLESGADLLPFETPDGVVYVPGPGRKPANYLDRLFAGAVYFILGAREAGLPLKAIYVALDEYYSDSIERLDIKSLPATVAYLRRLGYNPQTFDDVLRDIHDLARKAGVAIVLYWTSLVDDSAVISLAHEAMRKLAPMVDMFVGFPRRYLSGVMRCWSRDGLMGVTVWGVPAVPLESMPRCPECLFPLLEVFASYEPPESSVHVDIVPVAGAYSAGVTVEGVSPGDTVVVTAPGVSKTVLVDGDSVYVDLSDAGYEVLTRLLAGGELHVAVVRSFSSIARALTLPSYIIVRVAGPGFEGDVPVPFQASVSNCSTVAVFKPGVYRVVFEKTGGYVVARVYARLGELLWETPPSSVITMDGYGIVGGLRVGVARHLVLVATPSGVVEPARHQNLGEHLTVWVFGRLTISAR